MEEKRTGPSECAADCRRVSWIRGVPENRFLPTLDLILGGVALHAPSPPWQTEGTWHFPGPSSLLAILHIISKHPPATCSRQSGPAPRFFQQSSCLLPCLRPLFFCYNLLPFSLKQLLFSLKQLQQDLFVPVTGLGCDQALSSLGFIPISQIHFQRWFL